jgi:hypothetical protein
LAGLPAALVGQSENQASAALFRTLPNRKAIPGIHFIAGMDVDLF